MATLTGKTIAGSYKDLLKINANAYQSGVDGTLRAIEDGDATASALWLATDSALISGDGNKLYFYDADGDEHISADNAGVLSIAAGAEIDLTATAVDINGTADISGAVGLASSSGVTTIGSSNGLTVSAAGVLTVNSATDASSSTSGSTIIDGGVGIAKKLYVGTDLDVDGTANLDVVDIDGAVDMASTLTVGDNIEILVDKNIHVSADTGQVGLFGGSGSALGADINLMGEDRAGNAGAMHLVFGGKTTASNAQSQCNFKIRRYDENGAGAGTTYLEIDKDGDVTVSAGDLIFGTAGKGISFSSTQIPAQVAGTGSHNTLDDYEEGVTGNITFTSASGTIGQSLTKTLQYTKIGRVVFISGYMHNNGFTSTPSGTILMSGLPFTSTGELTEKAEIGVLWVRTNGSSADATFPIVIQSEATTGTIGYPNATTWDTDVDLFISGFYIAAT